MTDYHIKKEEIFCVFKKNLFILLDYCIYSVKRYSTVRGGHLDACVWVVCHDGMIQCYSNNIINLFIYVILLKHYKWDFVYCKYLYTLIIYCPNWASTTGSLVNKFWNTEIELFLRISRSINELSVFCIFQSVCLLIEVFEKGWSQSSPVLCGFSLISFGFRF